MCVYPRYYDINIIIIFWFAGMRNKIFDLVTQGWRDPNKLAINVISQKADYE